MTFTWILVIQSNKDLNAAGLGQFYFNYVMDSNNGHSYQIDINLRSGLTEVRMVSTNSAHSSYIILCVGGSKRCLVSYCPYSTNQLHNCTV